MGYNPLIFSGFVTSGGSGGGGSSPTIGGPVTGGTATSVLFINPTATLAQDPSNFNYNASTHALTITGVFTSSNINGSLSGSSSGTNTGNVTLGTTNGLSLAGQVLSLGLASTSTIGALSNTDWNTFNGKQPAGSYVTTSQIGAANGVASLDGGGKVPVGQLPSVVMEYQGSWNPNTNTPALSDGSGTNGYVYYVTAQRSSSVSGLTDPSMVNFQIGDLIIYSSSVGKYQLVTPAAGVQSVNNLQGAVTLTQGNVTESTSSVLTIAGGTNSVWGSGTSIQVKQANTSTSGYLSNTDWNTFNNKQGSGLALLLTGGSPSGPITSSSTISGSNLTGTNTGDQTITLTGAVTGSGTGSFSTTLTNSSVTGQVLTGFTSGPNSPVLATDSILQGLQKLQAEVNASPVASTGDINQTSFNAANNQSSPANITGFAFSNGSVRSFTALVSVYINATSSLYQVFTLNGIQRGSDWQMSTVSTGDSSGITFSITTSGQIQYVSSNISGFTSDTIKFRAQVTNI